VLFRSHRRQGGDHRPPPGGGGPQLEHSDEAVEPHETDHDGPGEAQTPGPRAQEDGRDQDDHGAGDAEDLQDLGAFTDRFLLCTGFSDNLIGAEPKELGICEVLTKPYAVVSLARAIRKALDRKAPAN
jgi:hypothetical protein